ncbi:ATP-binding protein [Curtobacterium ammoniigenes]|uniref:ATP-binding protein n=1 Tax=Curtobacterium ammoniigenes TaxID=395387 RepID=UPI00082BB5C8|nr:ATP-binding protein [Curtobacterium ammoniigenes]
MSEHLLVFDAPPTDVTAVHEFLAGVWAVDPSVTEDERMALELALVELTSNVLEHAADDNGVRCRLVLRIEDTAITASLRDSAEPGTLSLTTRAMPDAFAESGRGLALVQMLVDRLQFDSSNGVNEWTIERGRPTRLT